MTVNRSRISASVAERRELLDCPPVFRSGTGAPLLRKASSRWIGHAIAVAAAFCVGYLLHRAGW